MWRFLLIGCGILASNAAIAGSAEQIVTQTIKPSSLIEGVKDQPQSLCLALAIYKESRGEPQTGQHAVGHVILNRMHANGRTICQTIWEPGTFPWVRKGIRQPAEPDAWTDVQRIATKVLVEPDTTHGATQFYGRHDCACLFRGTVVTLRIGGHTFVRSKRPT